MLTSSLIQSNTLFSIYKAKAPFFLTYLPYLQCSFVVVSNVSHLSPNRLRSICRFQTPVVGLDYVHSCLQKGILLPVDDYKLDIFSPDASSHILPLCSTEQSPFKDEGNIYLILISYFNKVKMFVAAHWIELYTNQTC